MSANLPPWNIEVWSKTRLIDRTAIPQHQLGSASVKDALKAIVLSQLGASVDFVARNYVNARRGAAAPVVSYEPQWFGDPANRRVGWWCGDWEHRAVAWLALSEDEAQALQHTIVENEKHAPNNSRLNKLLSEMSDDEYRALIADPVAFEKLMKGAA